MFFKFQQCRFALRVTFRKLAAKSPHSSMRYCAFSIDVFVAVVMNFFVFAVIFDVRSEVRQVAKFGSHGRRFDDIYCTFLRGLRDAFNVDVGAHLRFYPHYRYSIWF